MQLLLAEDDPSIAALLVEVLTEAGFRVTHAATRQAALQLVDSGTWDLILTDTFASNGQPDPQDLTFLRSLAARAPVVLLTAHPWAKAVRPADLGIRVIVPKPFDLDGLLEALRLE